MLVPTLGYYTLRHLSFTPCVSCYSVSLCSVSLPALHFSVLSLFVLSPFLLCIYLCMFCLFFLFVLAPSLWSQSLCSASQFCLSLSRSLLFLSPSLLRLSLFYLSLPYPIACVLIYFQTKLCLLTLSLSLFCLLSPLCLPLCIFHFCSIYISACSISVPCPALY